MTGISLFFQLLIAHAVADFALQGDAMGAGKNRHHTIHTNTNSHFPSWHYWMSAHSLIHGGAVYIVTGSMMLGMIETVLHALIDFSKCEDWINMHADQALHILCKIAYCVFILYV